MGFAESDHYLHVYADASRDPAEPGRAVPEPGAGLRPRTVFAYADLADEHRLREHFSRIHVCRRFTTPL